MTVSPLAKKYIKEHVKSRSYRNEMYPPLLSFDTMDGTIQLGVVTPVACAGTPAELPIWGKVSLDMSDVPDLYIRPDSEMFFRCAHLDVDKDGNLIVVHKKLWR